MSRRPARAAVALAAVLFLVGCGGVGQVGAASPTPTAPTPTAACPAREGVELPPWCAPYDPEEAMAANDRYRERVVLDPAMEDAAASIVTSVREELEALRGSGSVDIDAVARILDVAGLHSVQIRDDHGRVLFGAGAPAGGCVHGHVAESSVLVDIGGYILDGGCLPAQ